MLFNSPVITHEGIIPSRYTCDGEDIFPPFNITYVPAAAQSLALILEDPDATDGLFTHLIVWNISADSIEFKEGEIPKGVVGKNSNFNNAMATICPPEGEHRYYYKLYALDIKLELDPETTTREQLMEAMKDHTVTHAEFMAKYTKELEGQMD